MKLIPLGVAAAVLALGLTGCGDNSSAPAPAATVTVTATMSPTPTPSETATTEAFVAEYDDVNSYVNEHLPSGFPLKGRIYDNNPKLDGSYMSVCNEADGDKPSGAYRSSFVSGLIKTPIGGTRLTREQGGVLFDAIVAGCYKTGHASKPWVFNAKDYRYGDVMTALHKAGFDDLLEKATGLDKAVKESCQTISGEKRGSYEPRQDRSAWVRTLTGSDGDWSWSEARATKFVDTLFDACYSTGRSKPYVPPVPTFGDGTWRVGKDVPPGSYRVASADGYCLWYRLNKMSSGTDATAIISWGWAGEGDPVLATIEPGDVAFQSMGCGTWKKVG